MKHVVKRIVDGLAEIVPAIQSTSCCGKACCPRRFGQPLCRFRRCGPEGSAGRPSRACVSRIVRTRKFPLELTRSSCDSPEKKDTGDKPAAAAPSLFGGFGAAAGTTPAASKPAAPAGSLFGGVPPAAPAKPSAGSSNLNPNNNNNQTTKTVALGEQAPSFVKGKTFNEIVERFEQELGTQVKTFKDQAAEVREWDMVLMQNASSVSFPLEREKHVPIPQLKTTRYRSDCRIVLGHATSRDRTSQYPCYVGRC